MGKESCITTAVQVMSDNLFSGLKQLGLGDISELEVYGEEKKPEQQEKAKAPELTEEEMLYDKTYKCPLCDRTFKTKVIRAGKNKLIGTDTDLRAKYNIVDPIKYDCIVCDNCGYAALTRFYGKVTSKQLELIKENISLKFKGIDATAPVYSYDEAFIRYQLALANAIVRKAHESEKGYICLKTAWLIREKAEHLTEDMEGIEEAREELKNQEMQFIQKAYEGFKIAMQKESFPICGMDEYTFLYVTAELARKCKDYSISLKLISDIITSRTASPKIKDRAREIKDMIKEEVSKK